MLKRVALFVLLGVAALVFLAACGGSESGEGPVTTLDFDRVCKGEGVARATAYNPAAPGPHTVIIMSDSTIGAQYDEYFSRFTSDLPEAWFAPIVDGTYDFSTVQLVACVHRAAADFMEGCEFEDGYMLNVHDTTFELSLRAAQTGEILAQETVHRPSECPMMHMFEEGITEEDYFEDVEDPQIQAFIEPFVMP